MCFAHSQYKGGGLRPPPFVVSFVLALSKAHVLALNTAHVLRLNKADVLALNKAHVLHLNTKICPVLTANSKTKYLLKSPQKAQNEKVGFPEKVLDTS